jgi:hypothetical protein
LAKSSSYDNGHKIFKKLLHSFSGCRELPPSPLAFRRIHDTSENLWPLALLPVGNAGKKKKKKNRQ